MDVNEELKFLGKIKKKKNFGGGVRGGWVRVGGGRGVGLGGGTGLGGQGGCD